MEPYYIDESIATEITQDFNAVADKANKLIGIYTQVTGLKIDSMHKFKMLCEDPMAFWKEEYLKKNEKKFGSLANLDMIDLDSLIKTPPNFDLIEREAKQFKQSDLTTHFIIEGGALITSPSFNEYLKSKTHFYAQGPEENKRLKLALNLIESYEAFEETLFETMGENRSKKYLIGSKSYIPDFKVYGGHSPILKKTTKREFISGSFRATSAVLYPNPKFVRAGFKEGKY